MKFIIEEKDDIKDYFDFEIELIKCVDYLKWCGKDIELSRVSVYDLLKDMTDKDLLYYSNYIPVGNLEFVNTYIKLIYLRKHELIKNTLNYSSVDVRRNNVCFLNDVKPLNVPAFLEPYSGRQLKILPVEEVKNLNNVFIKSINKYKGDSNLNYKGVWEKSVFNEDYYLVSNLINIDSEYRAFIINHNIEDVRQYSGNWKDNYNKESLLNFVDLIRKESINSVLPSSYTLDIFVNEDKTYVMEVHPFVSCGLYGYSNFDKLPFMFIQGFYYYLNEYKKIYNI